jgi:AraC-like DNA-binding protein
VGFSDQSHLALHFKRVYGTTPRAFRNSATGGGLGRTCDESRNSPTGFPTPDDLQEAA